MSAEVEECREKLEGVYKELRSTFHGTVPIDIRRTIDQYISESDNLLSRLKYDEPHSNNKCESECSHASSSSSRKTLLAAQIASLKVEAEAKETRRQVELASREADEKIRRAQHEAETEKIRQQIEQQRVQTELEKTQAELKVLEGQELRNPMFSQSNPFVQATHSTPFNINAPPFVPRHQTPVSPPVDTSTANLSMMLKSFNDSLHLSRLPVPEPKVFSGDPLQFPIWKASFDTLIVSKNIPSTERLYYMQTYLKGEAREAVEALFYFNTEDAYNEARCILDDRFGSPFMVTEAFRDKLETWPKVGGNDPKGLRKFADFLRQCTTAMLHVEDLKILNDCRENRKILQKLPDWIVRRWSRIVAEKKNSYPDFAAFVKFVSKEADIACNPTTMMKSSKSKADEPREPKKKFSSAKILVTDSTAEAKNQKNSNMECEKSRVKTDSTKGNLTCLFCDKQRHSIKQCFTFKKKTPLERHQFVTKSGLCFGCLTKGHLSRDCPNKDICDECQKKHPTCLHGDYEALHPNENKDKQPPGNPQSVALTTAASINQMCSSMILPVFVSSDEKPEEEVLVYALLDTQSDTTFILEETLDKLQAPTESAKLKLSTMTLSSVINCRKTWNLKIRGKQSSEEVFLPVAYSRNFIPTNREHIPTKDTVARWSHLREVSKQMSALQDCEVGLLIGFNCPEALVPLEVIHGENEEPYAIKTKLGWSVIGRMFTPDDGEHVSHRILTTSVPEDLQIDSRAQVQFVASTKVTEDFPAPEIVKILESDFQETKYEDKTMSQEDIEFLKIVKTEVHQDEEGYYEMPLPFREDHPMLPCNKDMAKKRLDHLKRRLEKDPRYHEDYKKFMNEILARGDAEEVPREEVNIQRAWYIPHHGVYHPKKPEKLRVVFDCSARWRGESLNRHLLQGPDLLNSLTGVLCRFREKPVAVVGDVEKMFHQFRVRPEDRDYLRFLWWKDGDVSLEPTMYRMKVHLFGATSSPGCANFGLKKLAADYREEHGEKASDFLVNSFYVDDGLGSFSTPDEAIQLVKDVRSLCAAGNLRFHKILSNSEQVMSSVPESEHAAETKTYALEDTLTVGRVLGIEWSVESDQFKYRFSVPAKPMTRRGVLSTVASIYDPLGCLAPFVLSGKQLLQQLCRERHSWDDPLPEALQSQWEHWIRDIPRLADLTIQRCFVPEDFGTVTRCELHHFSDASFSGYGQCSYLRLINDKRQVHCTLVMGKSRVVPLRPITMPRLELTAAVVSLKISNFLRNELTYQNIKEWFWTDSKVVLGYINNSARRFHVFVANRIEQIRRSSSPEQWKYVPSKDNPADHASRGLSAEELVNSNWLTGPDFLWDSSHEISKKVDINYELPAEDPEVRKVTVNTVQTEPTKSMIDRLAVFSSWQSVITAITVIMKAISKKKSSKEKESDKRHAEMELARIIQTDAFQDEICLIRQRKTLPKGNRLTKLDPFLDDNSILRVGGRLRRSTLPYGEKHPIILPGSGHLVQLFVRNCHSKVAHQGRGFTVNKIRSEGFWILGCSKVVSRSIYNCVTCRKLRGQNLGQKMADLPEARLEPTPPFTHCGIDCFGPFLVKEGRRELKRYGLIITCMASRAIHVETLDDLTTDSFINGLRCLVALRGPVTSIKCDQGSNFIGADRELKQALKEINDERLRTFLEDNMCTFELNSPHASHMGGSWERHIRTIRSVLTGILHQHSGRLDTATLRTFLYEAMAVVNSRPLTTQDLYDPRTEPLTPNHLLTMKTRVLLPAPGKFVREDIYAAKRWRKVQYLAQEFWTRWRKEFLSSLQTRQKWHKTERNLEAGDLVILKDENLVRAHWRVAKILETITDEDNLVRRVKLAVGDPKLSRDGKRLANLTVLERPVHKLTLLLMNEETHD